MTIYHKPGSTLIAAALLAIGAPPAIARQTTPPATGAMAPQPTPDADALAAEMRVLADDPKNVDALIGAGELTLKLGDPTAASVLFQRAENIEPNSGRLKADEAAGLVHMERPGEALRLFDEADKLGYDPAKFAAEQGLAYDLIGQQERAQRDYRLALRNDPDDLETIRRYALSLGISGKRKEALDEIDPLVRRSDHAGWRDRAFILAMNGDPDQAEKIAQGMLPPAMADGLKPFFDRLPQLSPADRAFAVHFGEVAPTPERLADARMIPALPPLAPETAREVAVAEPVAVPEPSKSKKHHDRKQHLAPGRTAYAANDVAVPTPGFSDRATARQQAATTSAVPPATATPVPTTPREAIPAERNVRVAEQPAEHKTPPTSPPATVSMPAVVPTPPASRHGTVELASTHAPSIVAATPRPPTPPSDTAPTAASTRPSAAVGAEDRILQNIIAGITVPGSELGVAPMPGAGVAAADNKPVETKPAEVAAAKPDAAAESARLEAANAAAIKAADDAREAKKAAEAKAAADKKAESDKKAAAARKAADDKAAAAKKEAEKKAKAEPSRIWVQVAGGADEHDLPKAWAKLKAKAPDLFKGKSGWSTPLNATNRVLAGPFKTDDAAQDFVNALHKAGMSGFPFTSDAGQKIDKLPTK